MRYASFGSVSSGTMRTEDLLEAFASELDYQLSRQPRRFARRAYRKLINEARARRRRSARASYVVEKLMEALEDFAPPYAYFGAHPGDGADYGYWLTDDLEGAFDGLRVDDTSEVPRDYRGEVLHINDHGNATLAVAGARGKLREVWALV